ncbi:type IV conjugative transfer system lipoprotein TraV [Providencia rettgeri]
MKKLLILGALTLLAGCTAGMKDSFDCNATAQDSCMTMEEANQKAAGVDVSLNSSAGVEGNAQKRAKLPRLASLATPTIPVVTTASSSRSAQRDTPVSPQATTIGGVSVSAPITASVDASTPASHSTGAWSGWGDIGMAPPVRLPANTARLWIAPWIDEAQNFYQPAVVSFVVKAGQWKEQLQ